MLTKTKIKMRAMVDRDLTEVLFTEYRANRFPLDAAAFAKFVQMDRTALMVVTIGRKIVGHFVSQTLPERLLLHCLTIHTNHQRKGFGMLVMCHLKELSGQIVTQVPETNLGGQLFLKWCGFEWIHTNQGHYKGKVSSYVMRWKR